MNTIQVKVSFEDQQIERDFPLSAAIADVRKWALASLKNTTPTGHYSIVFLDPDTGQEVVIDENTTDIKDLAHEGVTVLEFKVTPSTIKVFVNDTACEFADSLQTGENIKQKAIECGAQLQMDFILSVEKPGESPQIVGNADQIHIQDGQRFSAIPDDDNSEGDINSGVSKAIDEVVSHFRDAEVQVYPDGDGGAYVTVDPINLGAPYVQATTWIGFHIPHAYPYSDIYPHFVRDDLARIDKAGWGEGMEPGTFTTRCGINRPAVQISRRSKHPTEATRCLAKLISVIDWLKSR